ncbi:IclR family transcriptional regulator [Herbihabitans rhizosphaerae]|uniref:IclR family transcriptional regulator n=1 Tax=Herbihabitans rhizosphaerae TaxID=1872711 RepID=A0A4Q7KH21_9PSEU|nr:helix-turn-helix domain-containing protein [Herbihabitans rhizosphaerae]RZS32537.1 IclR family transcriptional regulator [Herbihabitans rhizosphaerae]
MIERESVQVIRRSGGRGVLEGAFALLEVLTRHGEAALSTLATETGLPKATAHRLLDQLVALGSVQRQGRTYRIGSRMVRIGQAWQPDTALRAATARPLRELAVAAPGASLTVTVTEGDDLVVVGGMTGEVHDVFPLYRGAVLPPATAAEQILTTPATPSAPGRYTEREWRRLIIRSRTDGIAFDEVYLDSVSCVAAPIRVPSGEIVAALGVSVLDARRLPVIAEQVRRAAAMATANLARSTAAG